MALPSKQSTARGRNPDDLGVGVRWRWNVCVHRAGLASWVCDVCSHTGLGTWKGSLALLLAILVS